MIDPPRLRDDAGGSVGEMLSAARADGPRDAKADKRRIFAALAALEQPVAPDGDRPRGAQVSRSPRSPFGVLAGVGLAAIAAIGIVSMSRSSNDLSSSAMSQRTSPPSVATAAPEPTEDDVAPAVIPSVDVIDLPAANAPVGSAPRRVELAPKNKEPAASATTADELAAVERARTRLAAGDANGARREIASYRATFVRGRFVEEVDALEVEALVADGERAAARSKATEFAARYPMSPYLRRVRSVVSTLDEVTP